jgi:ATP phosphoribosyltransferase
MGIDETYLKVAVPNKGGLHKPVLELLKSCGYKCSKAGRALCCVDDANRVVFYFLRCNDIPYYVGSGNVDCGFTGLDFCAERKSAAVTACELGFGASRLCAAVPADSPARTLADLRSLRIGTSFPNVVRDVIGADVECVTLEGAVEISISLGVCDAIADVVETGATLKRAGLRLVGRPLFHSVAALVVNPARAGELKAVSATATAAAGGAQPQPQSPVAVLRDRVQGRVTALRSELIEYTCAEEVLPQALAATRASGEPFVTREGGAGGRCMVAAVVPMASAEAVRDELAELGCEGLSLTRVETTRL